MASTWTVPLILYTIKSTLYKTVQQQYIKLLLRDKCKLLTLYSCYLQALNMWKSPSKQNDSHFSVLDHKNKRMVGGELYGRHWRTLEQHDSSWEGSKETHQILQISMAISKHKCSLLQDGSSHMWLFFSVSNFYLWDEMLHNLVEGPWNFKDPTFNST
jgi:hypothetical protein